MKRLRAKLCLVYALAAVLLLSACGGSGSAPTNGAYRPSTNGGFMADTAQSASSNGLSGLFSSNKSGGSSYATESFAPSYDYDYDESYDNGAEAGGGEDYTGDNVQEGAIIQKDMLVYRGNVAITTKEYDKAIESLAELYSKYDCFIESSREYTNYRYYDDTDLMNYEATIRVNSAQYDEFVNGVSGLGVVSSKSSNVQNMNVEYSDTVTSLRIQQARLDRYLAMLESETNNEIAMQLEREITNIQIEVKQLENRKSLIETDVAYSYVTLTISEVKAYSAQVTHDDPLHVRIWAEIVNTYYEFTEFLTNLLFAFIHLFPYLVILAGAGWFVFKKLKFRPRLPKFRRNSSRRRANKGDEKAESKEDEGSED